MRFQVAIRQSGRDGMPLRSPPLRSPQPSSAPQRCMRLLPRASEQGQPGADASIRSAPIASFLLALALVWSPQADAAYQLPPLPFDPGALEPVIDRQTNIYHHDSHHAAYINNTNAALAKHPDLSSLTLHELVSSVGTGQLPPDIEATVRNQGGGAWNHDLWWVTLAQPNSADANPSSISPRLNSAIQSSFGNLTELLNQLTDRAKAHFGSGWAWLIVLPDGKLVVTDTLNQDNPWMQLPEMTRGIPILAIDVWEHSFYLKYGPKKPDFVNAFPTIINWRKVSDNYDAARSGDLPRIIGPQYDKPT